MKRKFIKVEDARPSIYGPFTIFRAKKNGAPFLVEEKRLFRGINGFMIQTKSKRIQVVFRRH